jgi:acetoin utilization deacetylase AcuC-like enzyme
MAKTLLVTHPACIEHDPGAHHPERPHRLRVILKALDAPAFSALERREAPQVAREQLHRVHDARFVELLLGAAPEFGQVHLDPDTVMSPGSAEAALRAAGGACAAVDAVMTGEAERAFVAVRPPGHHAERGRAMGFCLFNNVAVAARQAQAAHGAKRVAVVDFDVHHGNGTQHMFEQDPTLFYASTHQWPCYPGTGAEDEEGVGNVVNVGLPPGSGSLPFRQAYERRILPALDTFAPDLLIVSAGFDAHEADPLADIRINEDDYAWLTSELVRIAKQRCNGRVVSSLEGGYDLRALAASAAAHVQVLMTA